MNREGNSDRQNAEHRLLRPLEIDRHTLKGEEEKQRISDQARNGCCKAGGRSERIPFPQESLHCSVQRTADFAARRTGATLCSQPAS